MPRPLDPVPPVNVEIDVTRDDYSRPTRRNALAGVREIAELLGPPSSMTPKPQSSG